MYRDWGNVTLRDGRNTEPSCVEVSFVADRTGDIAELSACTLSDLIASREVSCVEVAAAYIDQIGHTNPTHNAIVYLRERDDILADAREKDELLASGIRQGWLHGFPLAIKDLAPTKGLRTTLGSPLHHDWVPNRDAQFVKQMKQSGADRWMEVVIYATLAGCPAINVPAGFSAEGLPMGLQIFARPRRDQACLQLAHAYEQATRWTSIRPLEAFSWGGDINDRACT